jgi:hypothetical protein
VSVLDQVCEVVRLRSVYDIEKVLPVRQVGRGLLIGEELCQLCLLHDLLDEIYDAKLVVLRDRYGAQLAPGYEVLPACEDLLDEVLGELLGRRQVVLP